MRCPVCDSASTGRHLRCHFGDVLRCRDCDAVFLSRELFESPPEPLYSEDYFLEREAYFFHDGLTEEGEEESPHIADFRAGLDLIESRHGARGRLLDIGCATGSFLQLAKSAGWEPYGVEISKFAAEEARRRTGCEVFCGRLEDAPFEAGDFDAVTMWDLLEHLQTPVESLAHARRLLKPGGVLLVNTPNENSLLRRLARSLYRVTGGFLDGAVNRLYHQFHLFYFSAQTLTDVFHRAGLQVVSLRTKRIPMSRGRIPTAVKIAMQALSVAERACRAEYELIALAAHPVERMDDAPHGESRNTVHPSA